MSSGNFDFFLSIGGAAGQGIATPGNILAGLFVRRGLHLYAYNAFQSIIRGGHIFLTIRISDRKVYSHGDRVDLLVCLNQDSMDRHLGLMGPGSRVIFDSDTVTPGPTNDDVQLCPMSMAELSDKDREVLVLRCFEGLTNQEVATMFELNPETTKKRFTRALLRLQQVLREAGFSSDSV